MANDVIAASTKSVPMKPSASTPRWLWHAIDRRTGQVLAYVFGARKDKVFLQLKALLESFGVRNQAILYGWMGSLCKTSAS